MSRPRPGATTGGPRWVLVCPLSDLEDNSAMHVDLEGYPLCVTRSLGTVHALFDECSHGQVALSDGDVDGGYVECWLHGSRFDLTTGAPTGPPATTPVPVYPTRISGGSIEVALPASTPGADGG
ncbi:MAG: non-heme iron oxygenase ferredoxin subunit [Nocardioides sp.]|nr:non-heme iron oxygenase ferredoxin subunit [Nocardioides sp.]